LPAKLKRGGSNIPARYLLYGPVMVEKTKETLAIALFGESISPRFCFAPQAWIISVENGEVRQHRMIALGEPDLSRRLEGLAEAEVGTLLCGGINRESLPYAAELGISVIWGLFGNRRELLDAYLRGDLTSFAQASSPCVRRRRRRNHRSHNKVFSKDLRR
jgi:predicted Fe-Mo cluster-binding NifX family protein